MNEEQFDRIAEALEGIDDSLQSINRFIVDMSATMESLDRTLSGCISTYGNNHFLCITGNVSTN